MNEIQMLVHINIQVFYVALDLSFQYGIFFIKDTVYVLKEEKDIKGTHINIFLDN